jgi:hypothetical protein
MFRIFATVLLALSSTCGADSLPWYELLFDEHGDRIAGRIDHSHRSFDLIAGIEKESLSHEFAPALLAALVHVESDGDPCATSHAGAAGLSQLMPVTARYLGVTDRYDPAQNLRGGAAYLASSLGASKGNITLAAAAYNGGPLRLTESPEQWPAETRSYALERIPRALKLAEHRGWPALFEGRFIPWTSSDYCRRKER